MKKEPVALSIAKRRTEKFMTYKPRVMMLK